MLPIHQFWAHVHQVEADLPAGEWFWITSCSGPARLVAADRRSTAVLIAKNTHRLATPEEIEAHKRRASIMAGPWEAAAEQAEREKHFGGDRHV